MVTAGRVLSLDVFRGLTVAAMVLVNNPGSWRHVYWPLEHAEWHGWTPTDLVFPFFLFMVGVAIPLGLGRRLEEGASRGGLALHILKRSAIIFALGLFLHAVPSFDPATIRIPGVLQRIAVCYLAAALLFLVAGWRTEVVIAAAAVLAYWAALELVPVPGLGAGNLDREGNVAAWLDRLVLGPHIWRVGRVYDPEGILSTVPAIATTLFGVLAGRLVRSGLGTADTATGLFVGGAVGIGLGLAWEPWLPINKALWTGSYAMFTAGAAWMVLAVGYWLIEVRGSRWWTRPFEVLGVNALAVFFLSTLLAKLLISIRIAGPDGRLQPLQAVLFDAYFAPWAPPEIASLAWAAANVLLWLAVMWPLFRLRIRLTV
jgi:predicted acyltransferase